MEENEKKELALQIIDRLKKAYPMRTAHWTMMMRGSCW